MVWYWLVNDRRTFSSTCICWKSTQTINKQWVIIIFYTSAVDTDSLHHVIAFFKKDVPRHNILNQSHLFFLKTGIYFFQEVELSLILKFGVMVRGFLSGEIEAFMGFPSYTYESNQHTCRFNCSFTMHHRVVIILSSVSFREKGTYIMIITVVCLNTPIGSSWQSYLLQI